MKTKTKKPAAKKSATATAKPMKGLGRRDEAKFKKLLIEKRDDLSKIVEAKKNQDLPTPSVGDEADQATQSLEKEILFELNDNERNMLDQIEAALRKMEKGAYGFCESCRKPIAMPRLKALPFARYCIACQGTMEHASF